MENLYLREWVEYHLALGFHKIYIYDNNDADGEDCADVLGGIDNVEVVYDLRGVKSMGCVQQVSAYNRLYQRLSAEGECDYVLFLDIDEFFTLAPKFGTVDRYFHELFRTRPQAVRFHQIVYNANGQGEYQDKPVVERFKERCPDSSFSRVYKNAYLLGCGIHITNVHYPERLATLRNSRGDAVAMVRSSTADTCCLDNAWIRHYITKSAEEYCLLKACKADSKKYRYNANFFFKYNQASPVFRAVVEHYVRYPEESKLYDYVMGGKKPTDAGEGCVEKVQPVVQEATREGAVKGIISLTSWRGRINYVYKTIESVLRYARGFKIVLVLSEDEFPRKEKELPHSLIKLLSDVFSIFWVKKNYGAYKKVLFTLDRYRDLPVISIDDDMVCKGNYFDLMYECWRNDKETFVTSKAHTFEEVLLPVKSGIKHTAGCCTLYPPYAFGRFGLGCLTDSLVAEFETDAYYSALKYYLDLTKCVVLPKLERFYEFNDTDNISPMRKVYITKDRGKRRVRIFEMVKKNLQKEIGENLTFLTANFNSNELTSHMIMSLRKQLGFNVRVTIMDNSTTIPWDGSITDNVRVIDNTNYKLTPNYNQASINHGYSIDYALKHLDEEWVVLCDCDVLFKESIRDFLDFTPKDFDLCGEVGHDMMPKDRLFPYLCLINNKKVREKKINFFDSQTDLNKGFDTGYSLLVNSVRNGLKIKRVKISDYALHLKGGVLRNKDYKTWLAENKELWTSEDTDEEYQIKIMEM